MKKDIKWKYYNHAVIPDCPPHIVVDRKCVDSKRLFKQYKNALLIRWTENYDCAVATNYWYVIKDEPLDITLLKSKRRYEINKGKKLFTVRKINPGEYKEEIFLIASAAYSEWPQKYRPHIEHDSFVLSVESYTKYDVLGVFHNESERLVGYALIKDSGKCLKFNVLRVIPEYEKLGVNSGAVAGILQIYEDKLRNGCYILDGARSVSHETNFQDYLEKYFAFRKAYCTICVKYRLKIKIVVMLLFPFRKLLSKFNKFGLIHNFCAVLKLEEYKRKDRKITKLLSKENGKDVEL